MIVYRFMSEEEYNKLMRGETLVNTTKHESKTDSVGFCFMPMEQDVPEEAYRYMSGIVSNDVCVVFDVAEEELQESYGIYSNPNTFIWGDCVQKTEYCTTEYDKKRFRPLRVCKDYSWWFRPMRDKNWTWKKIRRIRGYEREKWNRGNIRYDFARV